MSDLFLRLIILVSVGAFALLLVWVGRRIVETRRRRAFAAEPPTLLTHHIDTSEDVGDNQRTHDTNPAHIRILAFSSDDCHQCHQLQEPALRRVVEARGDAVSVTYIDAPTSPELTQHYQVLTLPTTVLLDTDGKVHAVNYGFANTQRLLTLVDEMLTDVS
jgi:thioredoxin 1